MLASCEYIFGMKLPVNSSLMLVFSLGICHAQAAKPAQKFVWDWHQVQSAKKALVSETKISDADRALLQKRLVQQYKGDPDPPKRAADTRVRLIDLNGDGI